MVVVEGGQTGLDHAGGIGPGGGGQTGYGEVQDFVDLTRLTRGQALASVPATG